MVEIAGLTLVIALGSLSLTLPILFVSFIGLVLGLKKQLALEQQLELEQQLGLGLAFYYPAQLNGIAFRFYELLHVYPVLFLGRPVSKL